MMGRGGMHRGFMTEPEKARDVSKTLRRLLFYLKPYTALLLFIFLLEVVSAVLTAVAPALVGRGVDLLWNYLRDGGERAALFKNFSFYMVFILLCYIGTWATNAGGFYMMVRIGQQVLLVLRSRIFDKILVLAKAYFDRSETGDLMSRLTNDTEVINRMLGMGITRLANSILQLIAILVSMLLLNWRLALISLTIIPVMVLSTIFFSRRVRKAYRKTRKTIGKVSADLEQNIAGVKVAQAFGRQKRNIQTFTKVNEANRQANVNADTISAAFSPTLDVLSTIGLALVVGFGGYLALKDLVTVGVIVAFLQYVRRFFQPIRSISMIWGSVQSAIAGAERIFELLDDETEIEDGDNSVNIDECKGRIEFLNVGFSYKQDQSVLDGVNFVCEPGKTVAIVGPTGAGKTTIISLLCRFYDINTGSILIDGSDIKSISKQSLRRQMGIVLQDPFLFTDTIHNNMRYGKLDATVDEVRAAAQSAGALDFIEQLPEKFSTNIAEGASNISIGQKQLISLARALLADPKILILDEATSNVDTRTELLIQKAIKKLLTGRTSIVIAHRLSTVQDADLLLVLDAGRIVESGTHQQLLDRKGFYYDLYMSQFQEEKPERKRP